MLNLSGDGLRKIDAQTHFSGKAASNEVEILICQQYIVALRI